MKQPVKKTETGNRNKGLSINGNQLENISNEKITVYVNFIKYNLINFIE